MYSFQNDYNSICATEILNNLIKFQNEQNVGYALDYHTSNAISLIQNKIKNKDADIYFLLGGTQTNVVGLLSLLKPYEAVICADTGHINTHETGALEATGHKIITVKNHDGLVRVEDLIEALKPYHTKHMVMPRVLYISNSTEYGTIYKKKELEVLYKASKELGLYLFLDGARLASALTAKDNDLTLEDVAKYTDVFYLGGTKNGAPFGEALVFKNKEISKDFDYLVKNRGALLAKGFISGIIFETFFESDLYFRLARHANECADLIREGLLGYVKFRYPNHTNQIFIELKNEALDILSKEFIYEVQETYQNTSMIRLVTSFNTDKNMCLKLVEYIKKYCI